MNITVSTEPTSLAIPESLTVLKSALRIEHSADDDYLTELMKAAADAITPRTGRQILTCTRRLALPEFWTGSLLLPYPKLISVTSITYYDSDGDLQTLSSGAYDVQTGGDYGSVVMRDTTPEVDPDTDDPVAIYYTCGYGTAAASMPSWVKLAVRELVRCWYEESVAKGNFPDYVDAILDPWKLKKFWE